MIHSRRQPEQVAPKDDSLRRCFVLVVGAWLLIALGLMLFSSYVNAAEVRIPERCRQYQRLLTAEARNVMGVHAPVAILAAQIHQESACRSDARSAVGALGLTQFMPATAADMGKHYASLATVNPLHAPWAIAAQVRYMRDLMNARTRRDGYTLNACTAWWYGLKDYNGGGGWTERQRRAARAAGIDADIATNLESFRAGRSPAAHAENTQYPRRILLTITPAYVAGGWGAGVDCSAINPV